jgi:oligopeptide transport system substrate-binding protein
MNVMPSRLASILAFVIFVSTPIALFVWILVGAHHSGLSKTLIEANRHKILLLNVGSEPRTLDPHLLQGVPERKIVNALFEGLVSEDPDDSARQLPGAAESWEHNADASHWTFHLRSNAKWSNGDPVTADDFVFSFRRVLTPSLGAPFVDYLYVIQGGKEFHAGKTTDFSTVGVKAPTRYTLDLQLTGPVPYLLSELTHPSWFPVHPATILRFGKIGQRETKWTLPGNIVGNGPFRMESWRKNDVIEVVKSATYWDAPTVKLNGINFFAIDDLNTMDRAFRAGQLHATNDVPLDKIPSYRRSKKEVMHVEPYLGVYCYKLNVSRKPLNDPRVRLALNLALDRQALVQNLLRGDQKPATGFTPPGLAGYPSLTSINYDPAAARQLLKEAGFPNGKGFPKFTILINTSETHRATAEAVQQMWKEELNIDVGIENQEWKVYIDSLNRINYDIGRLGWTAVYMDPLAFLGIWTTGNGNNNTHWANPEYDRLLQQAGQTGDARERLAILHHAEEVFLNEPPVVLVYWYTRVYLLQPSVKGWHPLAQDYHPYKFMDLSETQP